MNQTEFYQAKLNYETDSWDLYEALNKVNRVLRGLKLCVGVKRDSRI